MAFHERVRKLELLNRAKNNKITMIWVEDRASLTQAQIDSKNEIYVYLEI